MFSTEVIFCIQKSTLKMDRHQYFEEIQPLLIEDKLLKLLIGWRMNGYYEMLWNVVYPAIAAKCFFL